MRQQSFGIRPLVQGARTPQHPEVNTRVHRLDCHSLHEYDSRPPANRYFRCCTCRAMEGRHHPGWFERKCGQLFPGILIEKTIYRYLVKK